jgi:hypothetical protein
MVIYIPALHRVEFVHTVNINIVIHNFKQIAVVVKTQKQMFVCRVIPNVIINNIYDGVPDSGFTDAMLKSRGIELNGNIHFLNIVHSFSKWKEAAFHKRHQIF